MIVATIILASALSGPAVAIDGDTLAIGRARVRLCGIDAPERREPGGREARAFLGGLIHGRRVRCEPVGTGTPCDGRSPPRSKGRVVAQCFVGRRDIARVLVQSGHARDWPRFSGGAYGR